MKYTGPVFRPPVEQNSILLQVTVGCAHNSCTFCTIKDNDRKAPIDGGGGITYAVRYEANGTSYFNSAPEGELNTYELIRE